MLVEAGGIRVPEGLGQLFGLFGFRGPRPGLGDQLILFDRLGQVVARLQRPSHAQERGPSLERIFRGLAIDLVEQFERFLEAAQGDLGVPGRSVKASM